jgi:dUTP pyrophosphatase
MIRFIKKGEFGILPRFKTRESAGADFCLPFFGIGGGVILQPMQLLKIGLQIGIEAEPNFRIMGQIPYLSMVPRSSLRARGVSFLGEGIIDCDYRGEICALLFNHSQIAIELAAGEAIGQFILRATAAQLMLAGRDDLERGAGGFGSTGRGNDGKV